MASPRTQIWLARGGFVLLMFALVFGRLLPIQTEPSRWAMPDLVLGFTLAWVTRRPELVPAAVVAVVFLMSDLLFQRPPGLMAAIVLIATEALRNRSTALRSSGFGLEWAAFTAATVGITLSYRAVLAIVSSNQEPLALSMIQMIMTILAYPAVVAFSYLVFGISRPAQGEVDNFGRRL